MGFCLDEGQPPRTKNRFFQFGLMLSSRPTVHPAPTISSTSNFGLALLVTGSHSGITNGKKPHCSERLSQLYYNCNLEVGKETSEVTNSRLGRAKLAILPN